MSELRDWLLAATPASTVVEVHHNGETRKFEVRDRTVGEQQELIRKCRKPDGDIDGERLSVELLLACVYDPDTGDKVFDPADRDALKAVATGPFQELLRAANRAGGMESEGEVMAGLEPAPDDSSSS